MVKHMFVYIKSNMSNSNDSDDKRHTDSINYKIGQKIKHWRLIRKYTHEDLANKIGVPKQ